MNRVITPTSDGNLSDEDLCLELVCALVDNPDEVRLSIATDEENGTDFTISCAKGDRGRVIGKQGCNIASLRTLFRSIGVFDGSRRLHVHLENDERLAG